MPMSSVADFGGSSRRPLNAHGAGRTWTKELLFELRSQVWGDCAEGCSQPSSSASTPRRPRVLPAASVAAQVGVPSAVPNRPLAAQLGPDMPCVLESHLCPPSPSSPSAPPSARRSATSPLSAWGATPHSGGRRSSGRRG
eukprot:CAMPEP_0170342274 /NCGR_PEP_ID=MMETSP0116_2-20130129/72288_1 /TAXON_ID=400756 /ORGANISM="Durinskia baltica, Strain CSIRO CS-38" /LENGTH=139 /DNA_ID=CAMNT_0010595879 /DNA_START=40 /DNA_END=455 /DNA_ORIENTATION=-